MAAQKDAPYAALRDAPYIVVYAIRGERLPEMVYGGEKILTLYTLRVAWYGTSIDRGETTWYIK